MIEALVFIVLFAVILLYGLGGVFSLPVVIVVVGVWSIISLPGAYLMYKVAPPFIPTPLHTVQTMMRLANIRRGERVYDLGCGDGRIVCAAAALGARATGFEFSIPTYVLAKLRSFLYPTADIRYANFWTQDIRDADVVCCYLLMHSMRDFERIIWPRLRPGCRVVSHSFRMEHVQPTQLDGEVAVYVKPA